MSLRKLTENLENFQWTDYSKAGTGKIPQLDGTDYYKRPSRKALEDMESKFGPKFTEPGTKGPYGVADYMDGTKQGRGFIPPGGPPWGFTVQMGPSKYLIGDSTELALTPLSYTIAQMDSALSYGVVPEQTININPSAEGAWGNFTLPIETYSSRILSKEPFDSYTVSAIEGSVNYYGNIVPIIPRSSIYRADDGTYRVPQEGINTLPPGGTSGIPTFEGTQITHNIPQIVLSGPFDEDYQSTLDLTPIAAGAHGSDFLNVPLISYTSQFSPKPDTVLDSEYNRDTMYITGLEEPNIPEFKDFSRGETSIIRIDKSSPYFGDYTFDFKDTAPYNISYGPNPPFIVRDIGEVWGPSGFGGGIVTSLTRSEADIERIQKFFRTPQGLQFQFTQNLLQFLNPRKETRIWDESSIFMSLTPMFHAQRHMTLSPIGYEESLKDGFEGGPSALTDYAEAMNSMLPLLNIPLQVAKHRFTMAHLQGQVPSAGGKMAIPGIPEIGFGFDLSSPHLIHLSKDTLKVKLDDGSPPNTWYDWEDNVFLRGENKYDNKLLSFTSDYLQGQHNVGSLKPKELGGTPYPDSMKIAWGLRSDIHSYLAAGEGYDVQLDFMSNVQVNPEFFIDGSPRYFADNDNYMIDGHNKGSLIPKALDATYNTTDNRVLNLITIEAEDVGGHIEGQMELGLERTFENVKRSENADYPNWFIGGGSRWIPTENSYFIEHNLNSMRPKALNIDYNTSDNRVLDETGGEDSSGTKVGGHIEGVMHLGLERIIRTVKQTGVFEGDGWSNENPYMTYPDYFQGKDTQINVKSWETIAEDTSPIFGQFPTLTGLLGLSTGKAAFLPKYFHTFATDEGPKISPQRIQSEEKPLGHYVIETKFPDESNVLDRSQDNTATTLAQYYGELPTKKASWVTHNITDFISTPYKNLISSKKYEVNGDHGDLIEFSWTFFDPDRNMLTDEEAGRSSTINKLIHSSKDVDGNESLLIKHYSTLAYGHIPDSFDYEAKEGRKGAPGGSGTHIHNQLNYEKTLRSPSELNTEEVNDPDAEDATATKRPDWLEALSSKKGRGAPDGFGIRDKAKRIVDDIGDPGQNGVPIVKDDTLGVIKKGLESKKYKNAQTDKVNLIPYGRDYKEGEEDFIKFKFKDVVNKKFIVFRALLNGISDSITPDWAGERYIGRPDNVYVYQGTERSLSFTFNLYPKSKQEFPVLLEKLNYLIGLCYPSYTPENRMVSPFINLTLGDMFVDTPGFLSSLTVDVDDVSTWEIEDGLQFPKYITCGCDFTYIGKYLPSTLGKHYELNWLDDKGWVSKDGKAATKGTFLEGKDQPERTKYTKLFGEI